MANRYWEEGQRLGHQLGRILAGWIAIVEPFDPAFATLARHRHLPIHDSERLYSYVTPAQKKYRFFQLHSIINPMSLRQLLQYDGPPVRRPGQTVMEWQAELDRVNDLVEHAKLQINFGIEHYILLWDLLESGDFLR